MASRALVLGAGGITGIAWEIGLLAGLAEGGADLTGADLVVGTSAGAVVGAQITSGTPLADLYAAQLRPGDEDIAARLGAWLRLRYGLAALARDPVRTRQRLGRLSVAVPEMPEDLRRQLIRARLPRPDWPAQRLLVTAVDALSGEFRAFGRDSGTSLVEAVAASCAVPGVWPPVPVGGRLWMDGGMRSATNADLAAGHDRIVVVAPIPQGFRHVLPAAARLCASLAADGAEVALVSPDRASQAAIGRNMLDATRRVPAARAGHAQAAGAAADVAAAWGTA
jgi:NTE family protein